MVIRRASPLDRTFDGEGLELPHLLQIPLSESGNCPFILRRLASIVSQVLPKGNWSERVVEGNKLDFDLKSVHEVAESLSVLRDNDWGAEPFSERAVEASTLCLGSVSHVHVNISLSKRHLE